MKKLGIFVLAVFLLSSCVSKKKFLDMELAQTETQDRLDNCRSEVLDLQKQLADAKATITAREQQVTLKDSELANARSRIQSLEEELDFIKKTNTNLLDRLSDLSVVSKTGAESIKKSLETLNEQQRYIKGLNSKIQYKDSVNLVLVMKLKRSLGNIDDEDVQIEVKKGVVYISLSDKMLFRSGSAVINPQAEEVLGKIAKVVKDHQDFDILVEGHTDTVPISTECITDNWDLSVKRATSVVRLLQTKHGVRPERMTAGGRGEYIPKATNETAEGKSLNRRTEIIILPKLDQFFQLLEPEAASEE